jgi:hypothetical protein
MWLMNGSALPVGGPFRDVIPSWQAIDTGDFNGDDNSDILWENPSIGVVIWQMDGTTATFGGIYTVDPSWHPVAA